MPKELNFMKERADEYIALADQDGEACANVVEIVWTDNCVPDIIEKKAPHSFGEVEAICSDMNEDECLAIVIDPTEWTEVNRQCLKLNLIDEVRAFSCSRTAINGKEVIVVRCYSKVDQAA